MRNNRNNTGASRILLFVISFILVCFSLPCITALAEVSSVSAEVENNLNSILSANGMCILETEYNDEIIIHESASDQDFRIELLEADAGLYYSVKLDDIPFRQIVSKTVNGFPVIQFKNCVQNCYGISFKCKSVSVGNGKFTDEIWYIRIDDKNELLAAAAIVSGQTGYHIQNMSAILTDDTFNLKVLTSDAIDGMYRVYLLPVNDDSAAALFSFMPTDVEVFFHSLGDACQYLIQALTDPSPEVENPYSDISVLPISEIFDLYEDRNNFRPPDDSSALENYTVKYIKSVKGHSVYTFLDSKCTYQRKFYAYEGEPVLVLAEKEHGGVPFSSFCVFEGSGRKCGWIRNDYLCDTA